MYIQKTLSLEGPFQETRCILYKDGKIKFAVACTYCEELKRLVLYYKHVHSNGIATYVEAQPVIHIARTLQVLQIIVIIVAAACHKKQLT